MTDVSIWVITENPVDFPGKFVAREHLVGKGFTRATDTHFVADSLPEIRATLPAGLYRLMRQKGDDPVIVESWI